MNSCLYECTVMHHRLRPKVHHFRHAIFLFYLDLDELDSVARKIILFSRNRKNLYSFRDDDHEPAGKNPLKDRLATFLQAQGIAWDSGGRAMLLTLPRVAGYGFNPISVYFCFTPTGAPVCAVAEVGNTFREKKLYLLRPEDLVAGKSFNKIVPKYFYVSPFSELALQFDFQLPIPDAQLALRVDDRLGEEKVLLSTLTGRRVELTNRQLFGLTLKFPLVTLKVIALIHWHALLLWRKRIPFYRKAANLDQQREVLRPHPPLGAETK